LEDSGEHFSEGFDAIVFDHDVSLEHDQVGLAFLRLVGLPQNLTSRSLAPLARLLEFDLSE